MEKIYPRTGDTQTVYLNAVVKDPSIEVGVRPVAFRAEQCALPLSYQPRAADNRQVLFHCLRCEVLVQLCQSYLEILIHLHFSTLL